jgi:hypothetical protein
MSFYGRDEKSGDIVPIKGDIPQEAIMAIEMADEQAIVERLTRIDAQPIFAYSFPVKTPEGYKDVIGIGVDGAKEIAHEAGNIKVEPIFHVEERDGYFYSAVPVTNMARNVTLLGVARQAKYIVGKNWELTDRVDETAFVKAVNKAQRNGILSVVSQTLIAAIIARLDTKAIKQIQAPPQYGKSQPAKGKTAVPAKSKAETKAEPASDEEALKTLRQQISIAWSRSGRKSDERKGWQKSEFNIESLTEVTDAKKLEEILEKVKGLQPTFKDLGFSSQQEQDQLRKTLYDALKTAGYDTDDKIRDYLKEKEVVHTKAVSKTRLDELLSEVQGAKETAQEAEEIPEDV